MSPDTTKPGPCQKASVRRLPASWAYNLAMHQFSQFYFGLRETHILYFLAWDSYGQGLPSSWFRSWRDFGNKLPGIGHGHLHTALMGNRRQGTIGLIDRRIVEKFDPATVATAGRSPWYFASAADPGQSGLRLGLQLDPSLWLDEHGQPMESFWSHEQRIAQLRRVASVTDNQGLLRLFDPNNLNETLRLVYLEQHTLPALDGSVPQASSVAVPSARSETEELSVEGLNSKSAADPGAHQLSTSQAKTGNGGADGHRESNSSPSAPSTGQKPEPFPGFNSLIAQLHQSIEGPVTDSGTPQVKSVPDSGTPDVTENGTPASTCTARARGVPVSPVPGYQLPVSDESKTLLYKGGVGGKLETGEKFPQRKPGERTPWKDNKPTAQEWKVLNLIDDWMRIVPGFEGDVTDEFRAMWLNEVVRKYPVRLIEYVLEQTHLYRQKEGSRENLNSCFTWRDIHGRQSPTWFIRKKLKTEFKRQYPNGQ